ncbi:hypothetical protein CIB84_016260, partial [Bambusicola thoracicus]
VRVRVHYSGLNFADILACQGLYQEKHAPPFTPGMEFSGTVMETGENVSAVKEGIMGMFPLYFLILSLPARETVLVTAGAGATGLAIIDLAVNVFQAKVLGCCPFSTCPHVLQPWQAGGLESW